MHRVGNVVASTSATPVHPLLRGGGEERNGGSRRCRWRESDFSAA